jgi:hypothetical protein
MKIGKRSDMGRCSERNVIFPDEYLRYLYAQVSQYLSRQYDIAAITEHMRYRRLGPC